MYKNQNVDVRPSGQPQQTYWASISTVVAGAFLILIFTSFPPTRLGAFWPFVVTKAAPELESPVVHDYSMALLEAAQNPDPNPNKGGSELALSGGSALVANTGPDGTATAYSENSQSAGQISLHVVREGESLSVIASLYQVSTNTILWANDIKDASTIQPGDTLLILPVSGVQYTVKSGGTLADVAKLFDADIDEIAIFNGIDVDAKLTAGTQLIVPGGNLIPKKTTTTKTSSTAKKVASAVLPEISGYYGNPVPGARLTQGIHGYNGVDLGAPNGTPVYAAAAGTVIVVKNNGGYNGGYGNYIVISHPNGTQTLYAHLSSVSTSVGATVSKGDYIGGVGSTGRSTGNHLHFEVRGAVNPFAR